MPAAQVKKHLIAGKSPTKATRITQGMSRYPREAANPARTRKVSPSKKVPPGEQDIRRFRKKSLSSSVGLPL